MGRQWRVARSITQHRLATFAGYSGRRLRTRAGKGYFRDLEVVSYRPHGFGSRLGELLNAHRLATALGARFAFGWESEQVHGLGGADDVFSEDFVRRFHLATVDPERYVDLPESFGPSELWALRRNDVRGVHVATRYDIRFHGTGLSIPTHKEAFLALEFHPRLERLRAELTALPRFDLVAHVRRWDRSDPNTRFGGRFSTKFIPLVLIRRVIEASRSKPSRGGGVLLLGNDDALVQQLATEGLGSPAGSLTPTIQGDVDAEVFRDFMALTRADEMLGGTSAFAQVAALVGGSRAVRPETVIEATELRRLLMDAALHPTEDRPFESILASDHLFQSPSVTLTLEEEVDLLRCTIEVDPEDPTRWAALAARLLRQDRAGSAEECVRRFEHQFAGQEAVAVKYLLKGTLPEGHLTPDDWRILARTPFSSRILTETLDHGGLRQSTPIQPNQPGPMVNG